MVAECRKALAVLSLSYSFKSDCRKYCHKLLILHLVQIIIITTMEIVLFLYISSVTEGVKCFAQVPQCHLVVVLSICSFSDCIVPVLGSHKVCWLSLLLIT